MLDSQGGIKLNSRLIQELTTEADSIGVPADELIQFVRELSEEKIKEIFGN
jgi:hypothetical protein